MKSKLILCLVLVLSGGLFGCSTTQNHPSGLPIRYHNTQYDFTFYLPESWKGYSVLTDQWEGITYLEKEDKDAVLARGPIILLRNPQWKTNKPYQDIPIYIFTRQQWDDDKSGKLSAEGAGGIIYELWHNDKYVFGIHSRFNANDSVPGWDEAQNIVNTNTAAHSEPHLHDI